VTKLVILEFEDDKEADKFVEEGNGVWIDMGYTAKAEVIGVYKYPTVFCECVPQKGSTRGAKFGWWICSNCCKAMQGWHPAKNLAPAVKWLSRNLTLTFNARKS